jgi:cold-inducible RNA-binding protein
VNVLPVLCCLSSVTSLSKLAPPEIPLSDETKSTHASDQDRREAPQAAQIVAFATEELVEMGRRLYVGNLPYETGETDLQDLFAQAGTVETVKVMRDMATGRARGFAFVEMSTDEEAQKAITQLNDHQLGGRGLTVNEARPKPERSGGFGGGGGGYGDNGGNSRRRSEPRW